MSTLALIDSPHARSLGLAVIRQHRSAPNRPLDVGSWRLAPARRGQNGVVWRAHAPGAVDLAIKLSVADEQRRGHREFGATRRIAERGLDLAPQPLALVVDDDVSACVATWCPGAPLDVGTAPASVVMQIGAALASVHRLDPMGLDPSTNGTSLRSIFDYAQRYAGRADRRRFSRLLAIAERAAGTDLPEESSCALIHGDPNLANVLDDGATIRLVDWEYGGAGDPCCDIADLCTSPTTVGFPPELRATVMASHAQALGNPDLVVRTRAYEIAFLTWWCARLGAPPLSAKLAGAEPVDPSAMNARSGHFRDRLAVALSLERAEVDRFLAI
jgi:Phosphotransferase enzyme family